MEPVASSQARSQKTATPKVGIKMGISKRKLAANRANAQKSTGPTSVSGVATSSQNRRTHGLCGKFVVLPNESQELFDELLTAF